jgi:prepilin-type N-terminal cleavage/methylation domain-containing protein
MLHQNHRARAGFTLLELLVVMAIIALLGALTTAALFRLRSSSQVTRTNETLQKLDAAYAAQWSAAVDKIKRETIPAPLLMTLGNDSDLAMIVHMKLRLRQEFPESVADLDLNTLFPNSPNATVNALAAAIKMNYVPKPAYLKHATGLATLAVPDQNAILFNLALDQSRGGVGFNAESGVGSVGTKAVGNFKVFIDNWDQPIRYVRFLKQDAVAPGDNLWLAIGNELNQPPYVAANSVADKRDSIDPKGLLQKTPATNLARIALDTWLGNVNTGANRQYFAYSYGPDMKPFTNDELYTFRLKGTGKGD